MHGVNGNDFQNEENLENIAELKRELERTKIKNSELELLINKNPYTELPIRRIFSKTLKQMIAEDGKRESHLLVMIIRLDKAYRLIRDMRDRSNILVFKTIMRIKKILYNNIYQSDRIDEFLIIGRTLDTIDHTKEMINQISETIRKPHEPPASDIIFGCNIGVAMYKPEMTAHQLIENAFIALEEAERTETRAIIYNKNIGDTYRNRLWINQQIQTMILSSFKGLQLHYQPITESNGEIKGAEVLVRWKHPSHGLIPPGKFIDIAEERGHIIHIDRWILYNACKQLGDWYKEGGRPIFISINISPHHLSLTDLPLQLNTILRALNIPEGSIKLEITERMLTQESKLVNRVMSMLQKIGIRFSIDDFGTGYSSLRYLQFFPVDTLKIDRSFINDIVENENTRNIVEVIILLAKKMGITPLAEGVEHWEQVELVERLGCNLFQGYYFAKPMESALFWDMLRTRSTLPIESS